MKFELILILLSQLALLAAGKGCRCYKEFDEQIKPVIKSQLPHQYLKSSDLPENFDWRSVNGVNYANRIMTQMSPAVCGSCWAEAATGNYFHISYNIKN